MPGGGDGAEFLQGILTALKTRQFKGVSILAGVPEKGTGGSVQLAVSVSPEFVNRFNAGKLLQQLAPMVGGKGGGKADLARGAGKEAGKVNDLLRKANALLGENGGSPPAAA